VRRRRLGRLTAATICLTGLGADARRNGKGTATSFGGLAAFGKHESGFRGLGWDIAHDISVDNDTVFVIVVVLEIGFKKCTDTAVTGARVGASTLIRAPATPGNGTT